MTLLLVKGDPKGYEEKEALDREVLSLESYLEALPSLGVLAYLARVYPEFMRSKLGLASYYWPFAQTVFTMTLFLRSGPCFILPTTGLFTWRFFAIVALNQFSFKIKLVEAQFYGEETFLANAACVSTLSLVLGLVSIHRAVGSWRSVFSLVLKFPPLLLLPIFGFVTFGRAPKGETRVNVFENVVAGEGLTVNWRWTGINFFASVFLNRLRFLRDIGLYHLHTWVTQMQPGSDNNPAAKHIDFYVNALLSALILSLFHLRPVHYGVLVPSMPAVAHVLQDGHLVPLVDNLPPQSLTRKVFFIGV